jgi:F0F1-type ATP synthase assembly protein I
MIQATARYSYIGIFFGIAVSVCVYAGRWVDQRWNTTPWLTVAGLLLGVVTGFVELYRVSKQALEDGH